MCRVLGVSRGGYYAWVRRRDQPPCKREEINCQLAQAMHATFRRSRGTYGAPRIHVELNREGWACSRGRVARLMRRDGLMARRKRAYKPTTTLSRHDYPVAPNLLARRFVAGRPDEKWLCDITYLPTTEGWLYLAAVLDVYSRKVVGWAMDKRIDQELVARALRMASVHRRPAQGLLHHSDRGSQYAAHDYQQLLNAHKMVVSMSRKGDCYDNAMMESFFATLKVECAIGVYDTREQARHSIFEYIEVWYNRQRRHSALGYASPAAFEHSYYQAFLVSTKSA